MELVDGEDLSTIIDRGPLPIPEALAIAKQIADALEAAHDHGIVHRDLKPANVKVRADGTVKVLDFGLAKAMDPAGVSSGNIANSPTIVTQATQLGVILGTAAYMAPEQARGKPIDRRADIWAFGVVLYEMLTGRRAFAGDEISDVLAAVLTRDVDLSALPAGVPDSVRRLLERCLDKDPKRRLRDIGEARLLLGDTMTGRAAPTSAVTPAIVVPPRRRSTSAVWFALPIVTVVAAAIAWFVKPTAITPVTRLSIALPAGEQVTTVPAISRDGRLIAYSAGRSVATSQLYLRALDDFVPHAVPGSAGAVYPFFSPDGRTIAFFAGGKLQRAPVAGGAPTAIAPAPNPWGGSWGDDGRIVYNPSFPAGLWRVSSDGGTPEQLTKPDGADAGYAHVFPQHVPGTADVLFSFWGRTFHAAMLSPTGGWRIMTGNLGSFGIGATHAADRYLLVNDHASGVRASSLNLAATSLPPPQTAVLEDVNVILGGDRPWLNVADNGTAVYVPGNPFRRQAVWVDREGPVTPLAGNSTQIASATASGDGRRVSFGYSDLWVSDLATGARARVVVNATTITSNWLPGDQQLVISSNVSGDWDLYTVGANGQGDLKPLLNKPFVQHPLDVAADGAIVYLERHPVTGSDLWTLDRAGKTTPLVVTPFNETSARLSPDGKYVAYASDESGRNVVYALPLDGRGQRVTISIDGGTAPVWSRDGRELFYRAGDDLMSVQVTMTPKLALGERRKLLDLSPYDAGYFHDFDVAADGRFLLIRTEPASRPTRLDVILNWTEELGRKVGR
jgi:serine/threonine-protein kinase